MSKILNVQARRVISRPKATLYLVLSLLLLYAFLLRSQGAAQYRAWRQAVDLSNTILGGTSSLDTESEEVQQPLGPPEINDDDLRKQYKQEYEELGK